MDNNVDELAEFDKKYLWHPFTQMKDYVNDQPVIISSGKGVYLTDNTGKSYLDGVSSLWVNVHGHQRPEINSAIIEQLGKIAHSTMLGLANEPAIMLGKRLVELAPEGLSRVFYSDTGATAVEIAIKMAFQFRLHQEIDDSIKETGASDIVKYKYVKTKFICLENGYHGDTIGAVSVGGIHKFHEIFKPLLFESYKAPSPYCYRCPLGLKRDDCGMACADEMEKLVVDHHDELVAVILEPLVQGAAGMIVAPDGYLRRVWETCKENDVLMIADEVATGFGRTGKMFACEHEAVTPDFMALAKGISGGYLPLAATMATEEIYNGFIAEYEQQRTFFHGHTYTGNPLACAAALANLEIFEKEHTLLKMQDKIKLLHEKLEPFNELDHVGDVRQKGFLIGIELVKNKPLKVPFPLADRVGIQVIMEARKNGLMIRPLGDVIVLNPPLCSSIEELDKMVEITKRAIIAIT